MKIEYSKDSLKFLAKTDKPTVNRIIYKYGNDGEIEILYIIDIGSRGDIYK